MGQTHRLLLALQWLLRALPASAPWSGPSTALGLPQGHRPESPTSLPKPCAPAASQPGIVSTADPVLCPHPPPLHMNWDPSPLMPQAPSLPSCTPAGTSFSGSPGSLRPSSLSSYCPKPHLCPQPDCPEGLRPRLCVAISPSCCESCPPTCVFIALLMQ